MWNFYHITMEWYVQKIELLKELNFLVRNFNKPKKIPREEIFGVCKKFIRKLIDYIFVIIDLWTASFGNGSLFTQLNNNAPLINHFGLMYIDFYEYPPYNGRISECFEKICEWKYSVWSWLYLFLRQTEDVHMGLWGN